MFSPLIFKIKGNKALETRVLFCLMKQLRKQIHHESCKAGLGRILIFKYLQIYLDKHLNYFKNGLKLCFIRRTREAKLEYQIILWHFTEYLISVLDSPKSKTNIITTLEISQKNKQDASKMWVASWGPRHRPKTEGLVKAFGLGSFGKETENITYNKIYM